MIDIPDLREGHCIGIQGFTELPVAEQLGWCHANGGCPVMAKCAALGIVEPVHARDDSVVFGGMHPRLRWELARRKNRTSR